MGISRDSRHKRRLTGGRMPIHKKKRAYESGRPAASTRIGEKRIRKLRVKGGNLKHRALRLNSGNFNWASEGVALKTNILKLEINTPKKLLLKKNLVLNGRIKLF